MLKVHWCGAPDSIPVGVVIEMLFPVNELTTAPGSVDEVNATAVIESAPRFNAVNSHVKEALSYCRKLCLMGS